MTFIMIWNYFFTQPSLGDAFNAPLMNLWDSVNSVPMGW